MGIRLLVVVTCIFGKGHLIFGNTNSFVVLSASFLLSRLLGNILVFYSLLPRDISVLLWLFFVLSASWAINSFGFIGLFGGSRVILLYYYYYG